MRHGPAVLDHIRDARWRAQVVFEHPVAALAVAYEVDAGHLDAGAIRGARWAASRWKCVEDSTSRRGSTRWANIFWGP